jgi:hypothetical protein
MRGESGERFFEELKYFFDIPASGLGYANNRLGMIASWHIEHAQSFSRHLCVIGERPEGPRRNFSICTFLARIMDS